MDIVDEQESIIPSGLPFAFYLDVDWPTASVKTQLVSMLDQYFDKFIAGLERSKEDNIPHVHVVAITDLNAYNAFIAKAKKTWSLRGRATKGFRKQYGKCKIINNLDNMISYTIKSGTFINRGYDQDYVQERLDCSYEKKTLKDKFNTIIGRVEQMPLYRQCMNDIRHLQSSPLEFDREFTTQNRLNLVEILVSLHHQEYGTILGQPMLKRYLFALSLLQVGEIAQQIGGCWINKYKYLGDF